MVADSCDSRESRPVEMTAAGVDSTGGLVISGIKTGSTAGCGVGVGSEGGVISAVGTGSEGRVVSAVGVGSGDGVIS